MVVFTMDYHLLHAGIAVHNYLRQKYTEVFPCITTSFDPPCIARLCPCISRIVTGCTSIASYTVRPLAI